MNIARKPPTAQAEPDSQSARDTLRSRKRERENSRRRRRRGQPFSKLRRRFDGTIFNRLHVTACAARKAARRRHTRDHRKPANQVHSPLLDDRPGRRTPLPDHASIAALRTPAVLAASRSAQPTNSHPRTSDAAAARCRLCAFACDQIVGLIGKWCRPRARSPRRSINTGPAPHSAVLRRRLHARAHDESLTRDRCRAPISRALTPSLPHPSRRIHSQRLQRPAARYPGGKRGARSLGSCHVRVMKDAGSVRKYGHSSRRDASG